MWLVIRCDTLLNKNVTLFFPVYLPCWHTLFEILYRQCNLRWRKFGSRSQGVHFTSIYCIIVCSRLFSCCSILKITNFTQSCLIKYYVDCIHFADRIVSFGIIFMLRQTCDVSFYCSAPRWASVVMPVNRNFCFSTLIPEHILSVVQVLMFVIAVLLHGRQVEWTVRLDFLWQVQANEEKREMDALQHSNKRILFNLLPSHVATHFLDNQFRNNMVSLTGTYIHILWLRHV